MIKTFAQWMSEDGGGRLTGIGLLVLRVWLGLSMLLLHGWPKLGKYAGLAEGFPDPLGLGAAMSLNLAIFAELFCALLLVLGLAARLACLPLAITMSVAFFAVHGGALTGEGSGELAFIYLAGFIALLFAGPGRYSVDHLVLRACRGAA